MAEQPVAQRGHEAAGAGARVKRRGLLAGAAALVAGMVAKQEAQPVAAGVIVTADNFIANGSASIGFDATGGTFNYGVFAKGSIVGLVGQASNGPGVEGESTGGNGNGVSGTSHGQNPANLPNNAGVFGTNVSGTAAAVGVFGDSGTYGYGVYGTNTNGTGVFGKTSGGYGVYGIGSTGVVGASSTGAGVYGNSSGPYGVAGGTSAPNGYGGYFATAGNSSYGLGAQVQGTPTGSVALYASAPANNTAGYFSGDVYINGSLTVANMANKHGLLHAPDGTAHLLYTMEAPESWAEDFGTGTLTNGKASVALEPLFASLVQTDDYHVFVTAHSDQHLHVSQRGAAGFTIEADLKVATLKGQAASELNGTFSWRVVAKPKGGTVERLGKYVVPAEPREPPPLPKITLPPEPPSGTPPKKP